MGRFKNWILLDPFGTHCNGGTLQVSDVIRHHVERMSAVTDAVFNSFKD